MRKRLCLNRLITESVMDAINNYRNEYDMQDDEQICNNLRLYAWNDYDIYKRIEGVINAMRKKDPDTISVVRLANSSVMKQIVRMCINAAQEYSHKRFTPQLRKTFAYYLAEEMVDVMNEL